MAGCTISIGGRFPRARSDDWSGCDNWERGGRGRFGNTHGACVVCSVAPPTRVNDFADAWWAGGRKAQRGVTPPVATQIVFAARHLIAVAVLVG